VEAIFQNVSTVHDLRSFCCVAGDTSSGVLHLINLKWLPNVFKVLSFF